MFLILVAYAYLQPLIRSLYRFEYTLGVSSVNVDCGYYKIPWDNISVLGIDDTEIRVSTENYIFKSSKRELTRSIPITYPHNHRVVANWTVELADHEYMKSPVECVLRNRLSGDSVKILISNFGAIPKLVEFQNDSDTTLLLITTCNFKRSDYCELGYIYVWPKI
jgi:hypothetical protein